jgi:hypothetical protein
VDLSSSEDSWRLQRNLWTTGQTDTIIVSLYP